MLLDIDLNMRAHYDFDLNELSDKKRWNFSKKGNSDQETKIKERVKNIFVGSKILNFEEYVIWFSFLIFDFFKNIFF